MKMLRVDSDVFRGFGEMYFSKLNPGFIKGWHKHHRITSCYAVPFGLVKLVVFDDRADSPTKGVLQEIHMSPEEYNLVVLPPKVWNGFMGAGAGVSLIAICADYPHDPDEIERISPRDSSIPYEWHA